MAQIQVKSAQIGHRRRALNVCFRPKADIKTLFGPSMIALADEGAAQEKRQVSTTQLVPEGAPQTEDINGSSQVTSIGTQACHLAEICDVHF